MLMIVAATVFVIAVTAIKLVSDMLLGEAFVDRPVMQDTFGLILTILILLEFNHSVFVALTERSGAIQARILVRITILVVARKLILTDFTAVDLQTLFGFGGLLLALGGLYWLISDGDRREPATPAPAPETERRS
ncbi:MAG TPA: phosphate-starvation-inducible PsiE family protein [Stellaceae bacterium]|nr:phosphate-starvation-inducible PsiE family protein [Stellaceae bacterium]